MIKPPSDLVSQNRSLGDWAILLAYRGSVAHGMFIPSSDPNSIDDVDLMGVCVPPIDYYFGLHAAFPKQILFPANGTQEIKQDEWDVVIYDARKFIRLLAQGNPNVLAMLWLKKEHYLKVTPAGQMILDKRELFVGKHVYESFVGYAKGQLHRMTHPQFEGYMGAKRKGLVEKYGYDCKNAAHLIRLLRMAAEFLTTGELQVTRLDAAELLEIKRGEWSLQKVQKEANLGLLAAEEALRQSSLPERLDLPAINRLSVEVIQTAYQEGKEEGNGR